MAIDYFNKWVEIEAYANIKDKDVSKFVWKNIIYRFGILQAIVADNWPQFDNIAFMTFCSKLKIKNLYSTPRHLQSNGQVEATNKTLLSALKKMLEKTKGMWVDELPGILWTYRTTPRWSIETTLFALAYGMDAIILTKVGKPTAWTTVQGQRDENLELERHLDWADEASRKVAILMASYLQRVISHYNRKVRPRAFRIGTLVLRKVFENTVKKGVGKLQANWKGPYVVFKAKDSGAYHLQTLDGTSLLR